MLTEIIGVSDTLMRNYLATADFEKKRVIGTGNKFVYELSNSDVKVLKAIIDARMRWYRKAKENHVESKR